MDFDAQEHALRAARRAFFFQRKVCGSTLRSLRDMVLASASDGEGELGPAEVAEVARRMGAKLEEGAAGHLFAAVDPNSRGSVSVDDLLHALDVPDRQVEEVLSVALDTVHRDIARAERAAAQATSTTDPAFRQLARCVAYRVRVFGDSVQELASALSGARGRPRPLTSEQFVDGWQALGSGLPVDALQRLYRTFAAAFPTDSGLLHPADVFVAMGMATPRARQDASSAASASPTATADALEAAVRTHLPTSSRPRRMLIGLVRACGLRHPRSVAAARAAVREGLIRAQGGADGDLTPTAFARWSRSVIPDSGIAEARAVLGLLHRDRGSQSITAADFVTFLAAKQVPGGGVDTHSGGGGGGGGGGGMASPSEEPTPGSGYGGAAPPRTHAMVLRQLQRAIRARRRLFGVVLVNVRAAFDALDRSRKGRLSRRDFTYGMGRLDVGLSPDQLASVFDSISGGGGGSGGSRGEALTFPRFRDFVDRGFRHLRAAGPRRRRNGTDPRNETSPLGEPLSPGEDAGEHPRDRFEKPAPEATARDSGGEWGAHPFGDNDPLPSSDEEVDEGGNSGDSDSAAEGGVAVFEEEVVQSPAARRPEGGGDGGACDNEYEEEAEEGEEEVEQEEEEEGDDVSGSAHGAVRAHVVLDSDTVLQPAPEGGAAAASPAPRSGPPVRLPTPPPAQAGTEAGEGGEAEWRPHAPAASASPDRAVPESDGEAARQVSGRAAQQVEASTRAMVAATVVEGVFEAELGAVQERLARQTQQAEEARAEAQRETRAVTLLQSVARGMVTRRRVARLLEQRRQEREEARARDQLANREQHAAATRIQACFRGHRARRQVAQEWQSAWEAIAARHAVKVQAAWRGFADRRRVGVMRAHAVSQALDGRGRAVPTDGSTHQGSSGGDGGAPSAFARRPAVAAGEHLSWEDTLATLADEFSAVQGGTETPEAGAEEGGDSGTAQAWLADAITSLRSAQLSSRVFDAFTVERLVALLVAATSRLGWERGAREREARERAEREAAAAQRRGRGEALSQELQLVSEDLARQLSVATAALEQRSRAVEMLHAERRELEERVVALTVRDRALSASLVRADQRAQQEQEQAGSARQEAVEARERTDALSHEATRASDVLEELAEENGRLLSRLEEAEAESRDREEALASVRASSEDARAQVRRLEEEASLLRASLEALRAERAHAHGEQRRAGSKLARTGVRAQQLAAENKALDGEVRALAEEVTAQTQAAGSAARERDEAAEALRALRQDHARLQRRATQLAEEKRDAEGEAEKARDGWRRTASELQLLRASKGGADSTAASLRREGEELRERAAKAERDAAVAQRRTALMRRSAAAVAGEKLPALRQEAVWLRGAVRDTLRAMRSAVGSLAPPLHRAMRAVAADLDLTRREAASLRTLLEEERRERRALQQRVWSTDGCLRVVARVAAPATNDGAMAGGSGGGDSGAGLATVMPRPAEGSVAVVDAQGTRREFSFDQVFDARAPASAVLRDVGVLAQGVVEGRAGCLLTLSTRDPAAEQAVGAAVRALFAAAHRAQRGPRSPRLRFTASCVEVLRDSVLDVLAPDAVSGSAPTVPVLGEGEVKGEGLGSAPPPGLTVVEVSGQEEASLVAGMARRNRARVAEVRGRRQTDSHMVFTLTVLAEASGAAAQRDGAEEAAAPRPIARLHVVALARPQASATAAEVEAQALAGSQDEGSAGEEGAEEDERKTGRGDSPRGARGTRALGEERLRDTVFAARSLTGLVRVLTALRGAAAQGAGSREAAAAAGVPYRATVLTTYLRDALAPPARALVVVDVPQRASPGTAPSVAGEAVAQGLRFAIRVKAGAEDTVADAASAVADAGVVAESQVEGGVSPRTRVASRRTARRRRDTAIDVSRRRGSAAPAPTPVPTPTATPAPTPLYGRQRNGEPRVATATESSRRRRRASMAEYPARQGVGRPLFQDGVSTSTGAGR